jgi:uroporphyrinogen decarboxylase
MIDIGINALLVFQTSATNMDAASIARDFGGKLAFYGGVDIQHLLSFGTPEATKTEVRANIDAFEKCGGYIVANSHHSVATIKGENIEAMCETARGYLNSEEPK